MPWTCFWVPTVAVLPILMFMYSASNGYGSTLNFCSSKIKSYYHSTLQSLVYGDFSHHQTWHKEDTHHVLAQWCRFFFFFNCLGEMCILCVFLVNITCMIPEPPESLYEQVLSSPFCDILSLYSETFKGVSQKCIWKLDVCIIDEILNPEK